jgi:hypothetical protein
MRDWRRTRPSARRLTNHRASDRPYHQLYDLFVSKPLLPHQRSPRLKLERYPEGPKNQPVALGVFSLFPAGGEGIAHPLLVLYPGFDLLAHVGIGLSIPSNVGYQLLVAPALAVDLCQRQRTGSAG